MQPVRRLRLWWARVTSLVMRRRLERELDDELRTHVALAMDDQVRRGMTPEQARADAVRVVGSVSRTIESCRELFGFPRVEDLVRDVRHAIRLLRRNPAFTVVAVLTLGLALGANTAIFTFVDTLVLRPLPVHDPDRLVQVNRTGPGGQGPVISYQLFQRVRAANTVFEDVLVTGSLWRLSLGLTADRPERVATELVSGNYFQVLGVAPHLGRVLRDDDMIGTHAGREGVVTVLSHDFWTRRLGQDPRVVGRRVLLHGIGVTIVGVAAPGFSGIERGDPVDVWTTLAIQPQLRDGADWLTPHGSNWLRLLARLKPGITRAHALESANALYRAYIDERVAGGPAIPAILAQRFVFRDGAFGISRVRDRFAQPLAVLMGAVAIVLLVACINLASLLLARGAYRQREVAVRLGLGASRARVVRQLLIEGLLLSLLGGLVGVVLASWATAALVQVMFTGEGNTPLIRPDWRVLGFTAVVTIATVLISSLVPALRLARTDLVAGLNARSMGGTAGGGAGAGFGAGAGRSRLGWSLVVGQVALSVPLLVGAGLFVRTLGNLRDVDPGFVQSSLLLVRIDPGALRETRPDFERLYHALLTRVGGLPRVHAVALSDQPLFDSGTRQRQIWLPRHLPTIGDDVNPHVLGVTPGYFEALGVRVVAGRAFDQREADAAASVAVVNESFARFYFERGDAVGQRFAWGGPGSKDLVEIVGVVKDSRHGNLREERPPHIIYAPLAPADFPQGGFSFVTPTLVARVAGDGDALAVAGTVRNELQAIDPRLPILSVRTMTEQVERTLGQEKLLAVVSSAFGGLAVSLAALGLYGLLAYGVAMRRAELGVRLALGARPVDVQRLVMRDAAVMVGAGLTIGLVLAFAGAGLVRGLLFGIDPRGAPVMIAATLVLGAIAACAAYLPSRAAARVDPATAMRND
jgi:predicted permease